MPRRYYSNVASPSAITSGVDNDDTTITIPSTAGYPAVPFLIALARGTASEEIVLVQGKGASSFTNCSRGYDSTSATSHLAGTTVEHVVAAIDYEDAADHIYDTGRDDHTQYLNTTRHTAIAHTSAMIQDSAVTSSKLATDAVTNAKVAADAIGTAEIQDGSITAAKIASGAIAPISLGANSVATSNLQDNAVTTAKIAASQVTDAKIATGISPSKIASTIAGSGLAYATGVLSVGVQDGLAVYADAIGIATGGVSEARLASGAVTTDKIGAAAVNGGKTTSGVYRNVTNSNTGGAVRYSTSGPSGSGFAAGDLWLRYT